MAEKQSRPLVAGFLAAAAAILLFAYLANELLRDGTLWFDASVRNAVHAWASPRLTHAMRGVTWLGSSVFLIPLTAVLVWRLIAAGRKHAAWLLVIAAAGAEAFDQILKAAFHRPRPEAFFGLTEPIGFSFPSGHSVVSSCFYGALAAILTRRMESRARAAAIWAGAIVLAFVIGLSRIYLGVHYPSDVLAGYAAGIIWALAVRAGYAVWLRRRRNSRASD